MTSIVKIGPNHYDLASPQFNLKLGNSYREVEHLFVQKKFLRLVSASFADSDFDDEGLFVLSRFSELKQLNLQGTQISNQGIAHLSQLKNLESLRLKDNPQLDNACLLNLINLEQLRDLQIQETSINQAGLQTLSPMKTLQDLTLEVFQANYSFEALLALSFQMPACRILAKGKGLFLNGSFEGDWKD